MTRQSIIARHRAAFTLVELLVVMGIIAVLISILLPGVNRAVQQAKSVACKSNLRQIGLQLYQYSEESHGYIFPVGYLDQTQSPAVFTTLGTNVDPEYRWPAVIFNNPAPPVMVCPEDVNPADLDAASTQPAATQSAEDAKEAPYFHSYVVNKHLVETPSKVVKFSSGYINGDGVAKLPPDIILMGEKVSTSHDYYMEAFSKNANSEQSDEFDKVVEQRRHGASYGSNYLYMDMHVDNIPPSLAQSLLDPWDVPLTNGGGPATAPSGP